MKTGKMAVWGGRRLVSGARLADVDQPNPFEPNNAESSAKGLLETRLNVSCLSYH